MTEDVRSKVIRHISGKAKVWTDIMESIYLLTLKDWIGCSGSNKRKGIPGIWGHSYVRTFNNWIGKPPAEPLEMEGGIATTYFVLRSLNQFLTELGSGIGLPLIKELTAFLVTRTNTEGTGVQATGIRGNSRIDTNLRHTCLAYLIMAELSAEKPLSGELQEKWHLTSSIAIEPVSQQELLMHFLKDSWPVGAVAVYIYARDRIITDRLRHIQDKGVKNKWTSVRALLIDAVAGLTSKRIYQLEHSLGLPVQDTERPSLEYWPFWHPINDLPILQLHSTLGCLSLMGRDLARTNVGRDRIQTIVAVLRESTLGARDRAPRFEQGSPPSIAAACAILEIVLGPWYEPSSKDFEFIRSILLFVEEHWANPEVYKDYWSEFTAPLLNLKEIHRALGQEIPERFTKNGLVQREADGGEETRTFVEGIMRCSTIRDSLAQIESMAIGGAYT